MSTPTIYEIKAATEAKAPHYFTRKTLKFFGQTMRSFKVKKSPAGRVFIVADCYTTDNGKRRFMGLSFREFTGDNLASVHADSGQIMSRASYDEIESYIATH